MRSRPRGGGDRGDGDDRVAVRRHVRTRPDHRDGTHHVDLRRAGDPRRRPPAGAGNGGAIFRADVRIGETEDDGSVTGGGTLVVRIPPDQLDGLVDDLRGVARVSNVRQDTQDVTDQLVDLDIRIRQARTGIAQIEVLYGQATELADLIEIEQELARRQADLERLLAAQRGVEGRVELSTLTITIAYEPPAGVGEVAGERSDGIGDAFRDGWDAFAGAAFAVGFGLAVGAPFIALVLVVLSSWLPAAAPASWSAPATRTDRHAGADGTRLVRPMSARLGTLNCGGVRASRPGSAPSR